MDRLPSFLQYRWRKTTTDKIERAERYPNIQELVQFIECSAKEFNDPIFSKVGCESARDIQLGKNRFARPDQKHLTTRNRGLIFSVQMASERATDLSVNTDNSNWQIECLLCARCHTLFGCDQFKLKNPEERLTFVKSRGLCANCLQHEHSADRCQLRRVCSVPGC